MWPRDSSQRKALLLCAAALALSLVVVSGARVGGLLQDPELVAHDALLRVGARPCSESRVAVIHETEADLRRFGHPWTDAFLVQLLNRIMEQRPAVIGVDKYRDIPVPPGTAELDALLKQNPNIVWIFRFGTGASLIPPPPAVRDTDRAAFNDLVDDGDGVIRRALLIVDDGKTSYNAFALALALQFVKPRGVGLGPVPGRDDAIALGKAALVPLEPNQGPYARADTGGFQTLIDFRCAPQFTTFTASDVMDGKASGLQGRIVVIGARAESLGDFLFTPLSKNPQVTERVTGAELHAAVTSQLVRLGLGETTPIDAWHMNAQLAYIALWCVLGVVAFRTRSFLNYSIFCVVGIGAAAAIAAFAIFSHALWIPVAAAAIAFLLSASFASAGRAVLEQQERQAVMGLFGKHVSPAVAQEIWKRRDEIVGGRGLKPVTLTASILFSDVRGFTTISEKLGAVELTRWLEEYMRPMSDAILKREGMIRVYIGDAIMALFGVPIARTSREEIARDALNAVRAAMEMREVMAALNRKWADEGRPTAGTRIGIHTGELVASSIGTADRLEYTVLGDNVNTAARLESFPQPAGEPLPECRILISAATYELVRDHIQAKAIGEASLKGKVEKVAVFQVV